MYKRLLENLRRLAWLLVLSLFSGAAMANDNLTKVVDGVTIYIGILPAEMIRGHPKEHPEGAMHGGVPRGGEQYHVMVALFDAKTGERINDADVKASVAGVGAKGWPVTLEPMNIANTITYGNYFNMSGYGPFRIDLQIRRLNATRVIEARFEHKHQ